MNNTFIKDNKDIMNYINDHLQAYCKQQNASEPKFLRNYLKRSIIREDLEFDSLGYYIDFKEKQVLKNDKPVYKMIFHYGMIRNKYGLKKITLEEV